MSGTADLGIAVLLRRLRDRPNASSRSQVLGRCERAALAAALAIKADLGGSLTAIAVGPSRREDRVLAVALRAGCDAAVRVWDGGLEALDYLGRATVLAAAVRKVGATVVLCGDRSQDELDGAIGPSVAELLSYAHVTSVVDVRPEAGALEVSHRGDGVVHLLQCRPPVVLCVLRHERPFESGERGAGRGGAIEEHDLAGLGIDAPALLRRERAAGRTGPVRDGKRNAAIVATPAELVARLAGDRLLP